MTKQPDKGAAPGEANASDANAAGARDAERVAAMLKDKLAPVEDFRARSEAWMKEITGQVARLASSAEGDEKKKGGLDKRIADLEQRIQSLLTLTELISLDKNPFAETSQATVPNAPMAAAAAPAAPPMRPTPAPGPTAAPRPDPIQMAMSPDHRNRVRDNVADEAPPAFQPAPHAYAHHPNDALHEAAPRRAAPSRPAAPVVAGDMDETRRRLLILEWAGLLSHELPHLDLGSFLGFYVETGWVDRDVAACVRNLAWQLHQSDPVARDTDRHPLPELHARSILMLAHLSDAPVPVEDARRIIREARDTTKAAPVLVTN